ncbi:MAG: chromosomal replication initiator protein DnaA [Bacilli bacterium]|jgi:chromosomal replication initiator protein
MDTINLWHNFLEKIKQNVSSLAFDTWFKDTKLLELKDGMAVILVPMPIHKKHLAENYNEIINETFNLLTGTNFEINYVLENELTDKNVKEIDQGVPFRSHIEANLNSRYTFDNFIVGESNRFAHAAALAVSENPGKVYNPLFIYGKSGLGKTHLMHAIGNYIIRNSNKKVLYVTSEQFIKDFLELIKKDNNGTNFDAVDNFKKKYRNIDVLIIDDIQFLGGTTKSQQEFFHTFNSLYNENKQIIISSDRSPDDLKVLEERLRTRFNWGLTVNIYPPDFNLRLEILKKKIANQDLVKNIPDDVLEYIANNCESDVRQLEGAVTRLYAYSAIMNSSEINMELVIEALKDYLIKNVSGKNNIQRIQRIVANHYGINFEDLKSARRHSSITLPRQVAMYLARILTDESYPRIGLEFGGRDHSTVIHAYEKINKILKSSEELRKVIETLKKECS